jgi:AraC-like DNA-binding protein
MAFALWEYLKILYTFISSKKGFGGMLNRLFIPISMMVRIFITILLLLGQYAIAQLEAGARDSLYGRDYGYFSKHISHEVRNAASLPYAHAWIAKAKRERNYVQLMAAYKAMLYQSDESLRMVYADSMLLAAKRTADDALIGSAYLTKGTMYYGHKEHIKALDNFLLADSFISRTQDKYLAYKVRFTIAQAKYYLGFYEEAISILRECVVFFEEENDRAYLNTLHALSVSYNRVGKYADCSATNARGIAAGNELGDREMEIYFIHSEGVNQYFMHHYREAIAGLTKALPHLNRTKDFANEAVANFYIGKSYLALHEEGKAIAFFKKVDDAFVKEKYVRPDLREGYEILIDHYKKHGDRTNQLRYIDRLLKVDSVLHQNYKYLSSRIFKQYDTAKLLKAKDDIEQSLQRQKVFGGTAICLLVALVLFLVFRHYANQKKYRQKYKELMNRKPEAVPVVTTTEKDTEFDLNPELVKTILKNLEKFEANKKYLEKDMNLVRIAELLHTNTKYVTKIIQRYRGKGTIEYISDLKIDHIVELLKTQNRFRNYTNKALGEEAGFGSTQNFTRAFKARNEISPTYFIQELKKDLGEHF